ncbi:uncharacterized protein V6R79_023803 [Siganus canaliculatus]
MSSYKNIKFPPLSPSQKQSGQTSEEWQKGEGHGAVSDLPAARKWCCTGRMYIYTGPGRKPQFLTDLENYVKKQLHTASSHDPKCQELKLQVYRDVFSCFIKEFKTYQPLLSAIKKEYETTLEYQQDQIEELEALRSRLWLVTEECDRKIQARWAEEQVEIATLKREKQQLQKEIEAMAEREKAKQAVVDRLQSDLSNQYLLYREERDARKLLIRQLNDLTEGSGREEHTGDENTGKDIVELQLALKVCRKDLTKAQEELTKMKAEYWDVIPRCQWDALEQTHKQALLQLKTLQCDFDELKSEHDALLELHRKDSMQKEVDVTADQGQNQTPSTEHHSDDIQESNTMTVQEFRADLREAFPTKTGQEIDEIVTSARRDPDNSDDVIPLQRLNSLLADSRVAASSSALDASGESDALNLTLI